MTPWLHATVLVIVVGSSTAVVPPGDHPHGTEQRYGIERSYGTEPRPLTPTAVSASPSGTPAHPGPAHGPRYLSGSSSPGHGPPRASRSPSASVAPSPSAATPSRAGSRAGEGRERPGRQGEPVTEDVDASGDDTSATESTESTGTDSGDGDLAAVPRRPRQTAVASPAPPPRSAERPVAGPKVFILPLGTGMVLIGLGLGLGLLALRSRRG